MKNQFPVILVVDDTPTNLTLMTGLLQDSYQVKAATSGEKALKIAFSENKPDLILLDIMMPEIDGYEVCRQLKSNPSTKDIPIIFLTAMTEVADEEKGLKLGAVDYITKPISPSIALARISTHITMYQQQKALIENQQKLAKELNEAAEYIRSALPNELDGPIRTKWKHIPSTAVGGDTFGYHNIDEDNFAIYLLDVCGHGVGSALMSVSAINALRAQTLPKADFKKPSSVLAALNNAFLMEEHNNKFFTMWYGVFDSKSRVLKYASAAHPPALLFLQNHATENQLLELATENFPIGFLADNQFKESSINLSSASKLYIYSDGVYEIEKDSGQMVTLAEFIKEVQALTQIESMQTDAIYHKMRLLNGQNKPFEDDYSFLELLL
jgi:phosphoserine phosphatase RsbU/P